MTVTLVLGVAIVIFALLATGVPKAWEEGVNGFLGVCLMLSPWVLGFENQTIPRANAVTVGILVTALAAWALLMDAKVRDRIRTGVRLHIKRH